MECEVNMVDVSSGLFVVFNPQEKIRNSQVSKTIRWRGVNMGKTNLIHQQNKKKRKVHVG